jgi:hypothetical protein
MPDFQLLLASDGPWVIALAVMLELLETTGGEA